MQIATQKPIPIVDLFAGPGGLGEGFAATRTADDSKVFEIGLSIEMDAVAHRTLRLRALYRALAESNVPESYYDYIRGNITRQDFYSGDEVAHARARAASETHRYSSSEVVREALRLMDERDRMRVTKLDQLRQEIEEGASSGPATAWDREEIKRKGRAKNAYRT
jgi:putative addiction module CopG family antidote